MGSAVAFAVAVTAPVRKEISSISSAKSHVKSHHHVNPAQKD
jgi:hypothetical protein